MTPSERRATALLALMLLLRMLALFMVLPVLSPWATELAGGPGLAVGLAVGIYGLTQAALQIPLGWISDRIGRKPVIVGGLFAMVAGSVVAAVAPTVEWLIAGRLLQGCGAIAATSTALLADLLRESVRSVALAIVGISIGMAFLLSMVLGPSLIHWTGVPGLFWLGAGMGLLAAALVTALPPVTHPARAEESAEASLQGGVGWLVLSVGVLHAVLAALFVALPVELQGQWEVPLERQWRIWLPTVAASLVVVFPLLRVVEKRGWQWRALPVCFGLLALSALWMGAVPGALGLIGLVPFFMAFNALEASLPSMLSRLVGPARRGRTMGQFSTAQFFGMFAGGGLAGSLYAQAGFGWVLGASALLALLPLIGLLRSPQGSAEPTS